MFIQSPCSVLNLIVRMKVMHWVLVAELWRYVRQKKPVKNSKQKNLLYDGLVFKVLQPALKQASIFHHIFLEFSLVIWKPAAKSLALLARWKVDPLWASLRAIERLVLTSFRFRASPGQWVKRECPGTRLECAQSSNKYRTCKRETSTRESRPRLLRVHESTHLTPWKWRCADRTKRLFRVFFEVVEAIVI